MTNDVLVVGAGPTGLVLALWLKRAGVDVRIIDRAAEPGTTSRALGVQARTLELYRQLGLADEVVDAGLRSIAINLWARGERAARVELGDMGEGLSPFPFILMYPQDEHERMLIEHLRRAGVEVERRTELLGFEQRPDGIVARLRREGEPEREHECAYLAGCDGGRSKVREGLGVGFPGGTYEHVFYVADVILGGPASDRELHVALDDSDFVAIFPMKGHGAARLIGTVKESSEDRRRELTWDDVSGKAVEHMKVTVEQVHWFSTYRVHHRVAERFARGRAFLAGDAAHVHSPVGAQGMNTGIGDAVNLAWKLAAVVSGRADASLLESYEPERIAFARRLVATTDRLFSVVTGEGQVARALRIDAMPAVFPRLAARPSVRRYLFRTASQIRITYRRGPLGEGRAGRVRGGDRLPWVRLETVGTADNFGSLVLRDWQVHVYGTASPELRATCERLRLPIHVLPWSARAASAGLERDAVYLVRPDGYVGLADASASPHALEKYADAHGLRFGV